MQHTLQPIGDPATLPSRAWKLREALRTNDKLLSPELTRGMRREALQMLLEVASVLATSIEDLRTAAKGDPMEIDTGEARPIKSKPFRQGPKEMEYLTKTINS